MLRRILTYNFSNRSPVFVLALHIFYAIPDDKVMTEMLDISLVFFHVPSKQLNFFSFLLKVKFLLVP